MARTDITPLWNAIKALEARVEALEAAKTKRTTKKKAAQKVDS